LARQFFYGFNTTLSRPAYDTGTTPLVADDFPFCDGLRGPGLALAVHGDHSCAADLCPPRQSLPLPGN